MQRRISKTSFEDVDVPPADRTNADDEVNLVDLWLIVRRRWYWLFAGLAVGVATALAYIVFTLPIFESRATLRVGNVPSLGVGPPSIGTIEDPAVLSVELVDEYGPESGDGATKRIPYLEKDVKIKNNILELGAIGRSREEARDFLAQIAAKILQRHERFYVNAIEPLQRRLAAIDQQIGLLTAQLKELGDLVVRLKESNPVQASLVAIERGHVLRNLDDLERERVSLQLQVVKPFVNPSQIVARPNLPKGPNSPRKLFSVIAGVIFGLVLGLVLVLLVQFFEKAKAASDAAGARE